MYADSKYKFILISSDEIFHLEFKIINALMSLGNFNLHLRKKHSTPEKVEFLLEKIKLEFRNRIIVHQHFLQCEKYNLGGIHLPESERSDYSTLKKIYNPISTSVHRLEDYINEAEKYKYVFYSPVFSSLSKAGYHPTFGLNQIQTSLNDIKPNNLIALGGINIENFQSALQLGFNGVALLGAVWQSENPVNYLSEFIKAFNGVSK